VAESFQSDLPLAEAAEASSASNAERETMQVEADSPETTAETSLGSASAEEPPDNVEHVGEATVMSQDCVVARQESSRVPSKF
jgi:hypothetical protein